MAVIIYLLLGCVGVPVFAGYTAGVGRLVGMTGGFLVGYIPLAYLSGSIYELLSMKTIKPWHMIIAIIIGNVALYLLGSIWLMYVSKMDLAATLAACALPFIPGDLVKMVCVYLVAPKLVAVVRKLGAD